jgi:hypothetical protein
LQGGLVAQGFELVDVVAGLPFGVEVGLVPVAAQVVEDLRVGQQVPDDDQDERPTATIALCLPRRRAMRR